MRCRDCLRRATAYVDGELGERLARAVRGHLRSCPACAASIEDEAAIRRAAGELEPIDPPPSLWLGIEARLAEGEVVEAERSPLGLRLLCALDGLRRHALSTAVVATAALLLLVWLARGERSTRLLYQILPPPAQARTPDVTEVLDAPDVPLDEAMAAELAVAVAHHQATVEELGTLLAEVRPEWSPRDAARFDRARAAAAAAAVAAARARLPASGADQAVLAAYRAEIALLTVAVSDPRGALAIAVPARLAGPARVE